MEFAAFLSKTHEKMWMAVLLPAAQSINDIAPSLA
jgi:hypothetical protein